MQELDQNEIDYHAAREGTNARTLIKVTAKNRTTGAPEIMHLWDGDDHQEFTVDGSLDLYYAAGTILGVEAITSEIGLSVRMHKISLNILTAEIEQLIRGYDTRLAPLEIHRVVFDLEFGTLIAPPRRIFKGWINSLPIETPEKGGMGRADATIASAARALTNTLPAYRSDAAQRRRDPNDRFREYADISGETTVWWGEVRAKAAATSAPAKPRMPWDTGGGYA